MATKKILFVINTVLSLYGNGAGLEMYHSEGNRCSEKILYAHQTKHDLNSGTKILFNRKRNKTFMLATEYITV
jgi:hypothetical protein